MAGGASISFDRCVGFRVQQDIVDLVNSCSPLDTCRYIGKAKVTLGESPTTNVSYDHHVTPADDIFVQEVAVLVSWPKNS